MVGFVVAGIGVVTGRDESGLRKELTRGIRAAIRTNMQDTFIFADY